MKEDPNKSAQPAGSTSAECKVAPDDLCPEETKRDPEDREVHRAKIRELREKMMDKTLADSYPASDPPSSIPNPGEDDSIKKEIAKIEETSEKLEQESERLKQETRKLRQEAEKKDKAA